MKNQMSIYAHKSEIKARLSLPLPGESAHRQMMSYRRVTAVDARMSNPPPRLSAVVMLLFPLGDQLCTLFIRRPEYDGVHSGQISFPGGKKEEEDPDLQHAALREVYEEVGVEHTQVEILGSLSEVYIPPSHFVVQPFVGWVDQTPEFIPDPREVSELLIEPLDRFFTSEPVQSTRIYIPSFKSTISAPYFDVQGKPLWGATAMILHEFRVAMQPELFSPLA